MIEIYDNAFIIFTSRGYSKQSSLSLFKIMKVSVNLLFQNWHLLAVKKTFSRAHKTGSWYLLGFVSKISNEHPRPFYMEVPL